MSGAKPVTEAMGCRETGIGRGAYCAGRSHTVRSGGLRSRENAGMSSESKVRIFAVESLRFPEEGSSAQGKSGPKPRTKVVGDGQQVDIPVPPGRRYHRSSDTEG
jgi:hypothetical protein